MMESALLASRKRYHKAIARYHREVLTTVQFDMMCSHVEQVCHGLRNDTGDGKWILSFSRYVKEYFEYADVMTRMFYSIYLMEIAQALGAEANDLEAYRAARTSGSLREIVIAVRLRAPGPAEMAVLESAYLTLRPCPATER